MILQHKVPRAGGESRGLTLSRKPMGRGARALGTRLEGIPPEKTLCAEAQALKLPFPSISCPRELERALSGEDTPTPSRHPPAFLYPFGSLATTQGTGKIPGEAVWLPATRPSLVTSLPK